MEHKHMRNCVNCKEIIKNYMMTNNISDVNELVRYDIGENYLYPDNSKISCAIYCVIWGDILAPDSCLQEKHLVGLYNEHQYYYSGETSNSYNTVLKNFKASTLMDQNNDLKKFYKLHRTIGNFMPFPVVTKYNGEKVPSLNQWKGFCSRYILGDFMDLFLVVVKKYYDCNKNGIEDWTSEIRKCDYKSEKWEKWVSRTKKVFEANKSYFDKFVKFECYCKKHMWDCFLEKDGEVKLLFNHSAGNPLPCHAEDYIANATSIIENRAVKIANELKRII